MAEDQVKKRKTIDMAGWAGKLDTFLKFNERERVSACKAR